MNETDLEAESWPLRRLLTEVMGSGPKSAEDMSYGQARGAMDRILDREPDPTTLGAFLLAARWKTNTPEELAGFLDSIRDRVEVAEPDVGASTRLVDCGANYDGKRETALLGVAAGAVSAAAGVPVVAHSADRVPAKGADAYKHVLDALGVETDLAPAASARMVEETGFGFYYRPRFAPGVEGILDRREAMGVRTPINTVETLANPADASVHLGSFYHLSYGKRIVDTLAASRSVDVDRALMIQGLEGYDDVRPGHTTVAEWRDGDFDDWAIETAELGMDLEREDLGVDDVAAASAAVTEAVLSGEREDGFTDAVALNAALRVYAGDGADTIESGLELARDAIADGSARAVLADLREFEP